jgi:hypothetical protein
MSFWLDYIILARPNDVQIFSASTASQPPRLIQTAPFGRYAWGVLIIREQDLQSSMEVLSMPASQMETDRTINFLVTSEDNAYLYTLSAATFTMSLYHQRFERREWPLRIRIGSSGLRMS